MLKLEADAKVAAQHAADAKAKAEQLQASTQGQLAGITGPSSLASALPLYVHPLSGDSSVTDYVH